MKIQDYIRQHEGSRNFPYEDSTGHITIGVGRNLSSEGISMDEEALMLENDTRRAAARVHTMFGSASIPTGSARHIALCDMAFNLGSYKLAEFKRMRASIQRGDWACAAYDALKSKWREQVGIRAFRDAYCLEHNAFPTPKELEEYRAEQVDRLYKESQGEQDI